MPAPGRSSVARRDAAARGRPGRPSPGGRRSSPGCDRLSTPAPPAGARARRRRPPRTATTGFARAVARADAIGTRRSRSPCRSRTGTAIDCWAARYRRPSASTHISDWAAATSSASASGWSRRCRASSTCCSTTWSGTREASAQHSRSRSSAAASAVRAAAAERQQGPAEGRHGEHGEGGRDAGVRAHRRTDREGGVDEDQARHGARGCGRLEDRDEPAHGVPDEDDGRAGHLLEEALEQAPVGLHAGRARARAGVPEPGEVEGDDAAGVRQQRRQCRPVHQRAAQSVHAHEQRAAPALPRGRRSAPDRRDRPTPTRARRASSRSPVVMASTVPRMPARRALNPDVGYRLRKTSSRSSRGLRGKVPSGGRVPDVHDEERLQRAVAEEVAVDALRRRSRPWGRRRGRRRAQPG